MAGALDTRHLLVASAAVFLVVALGPARILTAGVQVLRSETPVAPRVTPGALPLRRDGYLLRVAGLVLLATIAFTFGDYVFKSAVAEAVAPARLGSFFASFTLAVAILSIGVQLFLSGALMRALGVSRALAVLPLLVLPASLGVAVGAGLAGALLLRTLDGALRPAINKVGIELLFVPVPEALRSTAKTAIEVFGVRGGQALASVAILAVVAGGAGNKVIASAAAVTCVAWAGLAVALQRHYLDLFRTAVRDGALPDGAALPALDLSSLEALFSALNSRDDGEVLAALEILAGQGRARVLPALLLHHPSRPVVLRTLGLLAQTDRRDWIPVADRLMSKGDTEIRSAALAARTTAQPDEGVLREASRDPSPLVRATALVGLIASGVDVEEAWRGLRELAAASSPGPRIAVALAIEQRPSPVFEPLLFLLADSADARVVTHVARAMAKVPRPAFLPVLVGWLGVRDAREAAREALRAQADDALEALDRALADPRCPARVREHIPRTISRFSPSRAAAVLQRHLAVERDGRVRFKILRGLGRIATDHPEVALDDAIVRPLAADTADAAAEALRLRVGLAKGAEQMPSRATPAHLLLVMLLRDEEDRRIEGFFRLLQLRLRKEDVRSIHRGLRNADRRVRAASRELLENLVEDGLRTTVMPLVDELPDEERLARIPRRGIDPDYPRLLTRMIAAGSSSLRSLAAFHAGEIGLRVDAVPGPFGPVEATRSSVAEEAHAG
jgi:hypothetical protein